MIALLLVAAAATLSGVAADPATAAPSKLVIDVTHAIPAEECTVKSKNSDKLSMHYTGTLLSNGKQFDSSIGRGPFDFKLGAGQVIKGWDQGLVDMCIGEKRRLTIPADLGYGSRGAGGVIPPNAALVFDVELLKINGVGAAAAKKEEKKPKEEDTKPESGKSSKSSKSGKQPPSKLQIGIKKRIPKEKCVAAKSGDLLSMHYTGKLFDNGKQFDSSVGRAPFEFRLGTGQVIAGWDQGLVGMCVGEKRKLTIPPALGKIVALAGYGDQGAGRDIPGGATLVFDVELLEIKGSGSGANYDEEL
eukprot:jgi/Hompol1/669/HPOL_000981-RA